MFRALNLSICLCLVGLVGAGGGVARAAAPDPFFPHSGNRGYDVTHYDVGLSYHPRGGRLHGTATIEATAASHRLTRLSLDLAGMEVSAVTVQGEPAAFSRGGDKLRIVPATPLPAERPFAAVVDYEGTPRTITDSAGPTEGWIRTDDGAIGIGEPVGTPVWMPCNNTLTDKASFDFHVTVPRRLKGVANGRLLNVDRERSRKTFEWSESQPMAPYLAAIDIGRGKLVRSEIAGIPAWTMVDPRLAAKSRVALRRMPEIVGFESELFGPYPFDALGATVDLTERFALEAQTRPLFGLVPHQAVLVHELAHQWFGDSVGLRRWPDIWLNEGFATWVQWYYGERHGGTSVRQLFRQIRQEPAFLRSLWEPPPGYPGDPEKLFADSVYIRGAMTLEALRIRIGTEAMLRVLRRWAAAHRYGNAGTEQFIALSEKVSGQGLRPLFNRWLYKPGKP